MSKSSEKSKKEKPEIESLFYSVPEAGERLNVSRQTIYLLIKSGELPSALLGRRRVVKKTDVDTYAETICNRTFVQTPGHDTSVKAGGAS